MSSRTANPPNPAPPAPDPAARHVSPYSRREKAARLLWSCVQATLFRCSWPTAYRWRGFLVRRFGARIDPAARLRASVRIECPWNLTIAAGTSVGDHAILYCLGPVRIGRRVTISQYAHLCAGSHDYTTPAMTLRRPPITIGDDVWIAADAFVGPNVTIGDGAILGARGCAFKDLEPGMIYGGNPAKILGPRRSS